MAKVLDICDAQEKASAILKAPDKVYIHPNIGGKEFLRPWLKNPANYESIEYIRKDIVDDMLKSAEDHKQKGGNHEKD